MTKRVKILNSNVHFNFSLNDEPGHFPWNGTVAEALTYSNWTLDELLEEYERSTVDETVLELNRFFKRLYQNIYESDFRSTYPKIISFIKNK